MLDEAVSPVTAGISAFVTSRATSGSCWVVGVGVSALSPTPQRSTEVRRGNAPVLVVGVELSPPALPPVEVRAPEVALFSTASLILDRSWLPEFAPVTALSKTISMIGAPVEVEAPVAALSETASLVGVPVGILVRAAM